MSRQPSGKLGELRLRVSDEPGKTVSNDVDGKGPVKSMTKLDPW
jgi:hypothetical protein